MQRNFQFSIGENYHVFSRGVDKRPIFLDDSDYKRFVKLLHVCNGDKPVVFKIVQKLPINEIDFGHRQVALGVYCLMPNHIHLLLKEIKDDGIAKFMSKLLTAYSMYFNKKYERTGCLFESNFKAEHVDDDEYLKYLFSYIHLNPLKFFQDNWKEKGVLNIVKAEQFLLEYSHSSFVDFWGIDRPEKIILTRDEFPEYFQEGTDFKNFIEEWINYNTPNVFQGQSLDDWD